MAPLARAPGPKEKGGVPLDAREIAEEAALVVVFVRHLGAGHVSRLRAVGRRGRSQPPHARRTDALGTESLMIVAVREVVSGDQPKEGQDSVEAGQRLEH